MYMRHSLALLLLVGIISVEYGAGAKLSAAARVACLTSRGQNETIDFEPFVRAYVEVTPLPPAPTRVERNSHTCTAHLSTRPLHSPARPPAHDARTHVRRFRRLITTCARAINPATGLTTVSRRVRVSACPHAHILPPTHGQPHTTGGRKQAKHLARKHLEKNDELRRL